MIKVSFTQRMYQMVLATFVLLLLVSSGLGMANESKSLKFQAIADYQLDDVSIPGSSFSVGNISGAVSVNSSESKLFAVDDQNGRAQRKNLFSSTRYEMFRFRE